MIISDLSVFVVTLIPIWGFLLTYMKVKGRTWLNFIFGCILSTALFLSLSNAHWIFPFLKISSYSIYYVIFAALYMVILGRKLSFKYPFQLFGLALMIIFVAADFWEIPVFVYGFFNLFRYAKYFDWAYQIHHLYIIAVFYLFMKRSGFRFNQTNALLLAINLAICFVLLTFQTSLMVIIVRLINLTLIAFVIYGGIENNKCSMVRA